MSPQHQLEEFIERRRRGMVWQVCQRIGDPEAAEDVVQRALLRAFRYLPSAETLAKYRRIDTWVYRILHNETMNWLRDRRRDPLVTFDPEVLDRAEDPNLGAGLELAQAHAFIDAVCTPKAARVMHALAGGACYAEIAQQEALPPGTVRSTIMRARAQLRSAAIAQNIAI